MLPKSTPPDIAETNRRFYDAFWSRARLQQPDTFNTWPLVTELSGPATRRLEIGPGLRPRLPIAGTHFIDLSSHAVERLRASGGLAVVDEIGKLAFDDGAFGLVCAFDVIEHVRDDQLVLSEVSRVLEDRGVLILSVPVHTDRWTEFDDWVGHARRYDPSTLVAMLASHALDVERSAVFGMQPANTRWVKRARWYLENRPAWAMLWYNWVAWPLAMLLQKRLRVVDGLIDTTGVDEVVVVCRRRARV